MALAVMLSITAFLSKTWFDGVNANAVELSKVKESQAQIWSKVENHNDLFDIRLNTLKERLDSIDRKLDKIISFENKD